jgi:hypothetical protein
VFIVHAPELLLQVFIACHTLFYLDNCSAAPGRDHWNAIPVSGIFPSSDTTKFIAERYHLVG